MGRDTTDRTRRFRLGAVDGPILRGDRDEYCDYMFPLDLHAEPPHKNEQRRVRVSFTSHQVFNRDDGLVSILARWLAQSRLEERFVKGHDLPQVMDATDDEVAHFFAEVGATKVSMDPERWIEAPPRRRRIGF